MSDTGRVCDEDANCTNPNFHIHVHTGYVGKSVTITNFGGNTYSLPVRAEPVPAHAIEFARVNGDAIPDAELHAEEPSHEYTGPVTHAVSPAAEPYRDPRGCRQCDADKTYRDDNPHIVHLTDNDGHRHAYYADSRSAVYNPNNPKAR